jgi:heptosyltransferase I
VIELPLRRWTRAGWWRAATRSEVRAFAQRLRRESYDAVIDLQGLTKSAVVARLARGPSYGLANRTDGASHEWPARWLVTHPIEVESRIHALDRSRELVARVLDSAPGSPPRFGLDALRGTTVEAGRVVFIHGTTRTDKLWPESHWIDLGRRVAAAGGTIGLPQVDDAEYARARRIAGAVGAACEVWPAMSLDALIDRMAQTAGAIGVDSGPSHIAVALGLPHVQIYNHPTAWRTGPQERHGHRHQVSIEGAPTPSVDAVWAAWQRVRGESGPGAEGDAERRDLP